jgi:tetratricopeptide (TPR) repeat protein
MTYSEEAMNQDLKKIVIGCLIVIALLAGLLALLGFGGYMIYKPVLASYYYSEGVKSKEAGHVNLSKEFLRRAIETAPESESAKKAENYLATRLPRSDNISEEAIHLNIEGYRYHFRKKEYDRAIECYQNAIDESPEFEWPYSNMGMIYGFQYKNYDKALELLNKALTLNPEYFNARTHLARLYWIQADELKNNKEYLKSLPYYEKALAEYEHAHKLVPQEKFVKENISDLKRYINWVKDRL